jgi:cAMP-dependent protein kinase regulator
MKGSSSESEGDSEGDEVAPLEHAKKI